MGVSDVLLEAIAAVRESAGYDRGNEEIEIVLTLMEAYAEWCWLEPGRPDTEERAAEIARQIRSCQTLAGEIRDRQAVWRAYCAFARLDTSPKKGKPS